MGGASVEGPGDWVKVGRLSGFPEGRGRAVVVDGVKVGVFKLDGRIHALKDACPHMGASLADGKLVGGEVTCFWHGWTFDLVTGKTRQSSWACAAVYAVDVRGDEIWLKPPPPPPPPPAAEDDDWEVFDPDRHLKKKR